MCNSACLPVNGLVASRCAYSLRIEQNQMNILFPLQALVRMDSDIPSDQRMRRVDEVIQEVCLNITICTLFTPVLPAWPVQV